MFKFIAAIALLMTFSVQAHEKKVAEQLMKEDGYYQLLDKMKQEQFRDPDKFLKLGDELGLYSYFEWLCSNTFCDMNSIYMSAELKRELYGLILGELHNIRTVALINLSKRISRLESVAASCSPQTYSFFLKEHKSCEQFFECKGAAAAEIIQLMNDNEYKPTTRDISISRMFVRANGKEYNVGTLFNPKSPLVTVPVLSMNTGTKSYFGIESGLTKGMMGIRKIACDSKSGRVSDPITCRMVASEQDFRDVSFDPSRTFEKFPAHKAYKDELANSCIPKVAKNKKPKKSSGVDDSDRALAGEKPVPAAAPGSSPGAPVESN